MPGVPRRLFYPDRPEPGPVFHGAEPHSRHSLLYEVRRLPPRSHTEVSTHDTPLLSRLRRGHVRDPSLRDKTGHVRRARQPRRGRLPPAVHRGSDDPPPPLPQLDGWPPGLVRRPRLLVTTTI